MALKVTLAVVVLLIVLWVALSYARRGPKLPGDLAGAVETATLHYGLPAMAACVVSVDEIEVAAYGSRALDASFKVHGRGALDHVTVEDYWHIGSNAKAITATLAAVLYERGLIKVEDKVAGAFDFDVHPDFADVTLLDLLQHRSGLAPFTAGAEFDAYEDKVSSGTPTQQRLKFTQLLLTKPAAGKHGEFEYSNAGYSVAAAYLEARTGRAWEELLQTELFKPLGMRVRVGWPATKQDPDQPLGHWDEGKGLEALPVGHEYELPPALDPAGDLSMPILDYGKFLQLHLRGLRGLITELKIKNDQRLFLLPATIKELHEPNGDYSCGWIETQLLGLHECTHDGSTGTFYMTATIVVDSGVAVAVVTNAGDGKAERATHAVANHLKQRACARVARGGSAL
jgi:CubicO group peptidase (beta-lactamase class C family)